MVLYMVSTNLRGTGQTLYLRSHSQREDGGLPIRGQDVKRGAVYFLMTSGPVLSPQSVLNLWCEPSHRGNFLLQDREREGRGIAQQGIRQELRLRIPHRATISPTAIDLANWLHCSEAVPAPAAAEGHDALVVLLELAHD
jgi:hypothetical protein